MHALWEKKLQLLCQRTDILSPKQSSEKKTAKMKRWRNNWLMISLFRLKTPSQNPLDHGVNPFFFSVEAKKTKKKQLFWKEHIYAEKRASQTEILRKNKTKQARWTTKRVKAQN